MTADDRAAYEREFDQRTRWLDAHLAQRLQVTAAERERRELEAERRETGVLARIRRRLAA